MNNEGDSELTKGGFTENFSSEGLILSICRKGER